MSRIAFGVLCLLVCIAAIAAGSAARQYSATPVMASQVRSTMMITPGYGPGYASAGFQATGAGALTAAEQGDVLLAQDYQRLEADLYAAFAFQDPNEPLFGTMGQSASVLVTAGSAVLDRYQIQYPETNPPGSYVSPRVNVLYVTLIGSGGGAVTDALRASATSEEYHISALSGALGRTSNPDLQFLYNQELATAQDNLRSAVQRLSQYGVTYTPRYLTQDAYSAIIGSQTGTARPPTAATPDTLAVTPVPTSVPGQGGSTGSAMYSASRSPAQRPVSALFQAYRTGTDIPTPQANDLMRAEDYERMISDLNYAFSTNYPTEPLFPVMRQTAESLAAAGESVLAANGITDLGRGPPGAYSSYEVSGLWDAHFPNQDLTASEALRAIAEIEENHIVALDSALGRTSDTSVQAFYNEELAAARNNLRDTVARLSEYGVTYIPQVLSQQAYTGIISSPKETIPNLPAVVPPVPTLLPTFVPTLVPGSGGSYAGASGTAVAGIVVQFQSMPPSALSTTEIADIVYLQQSQKLQRDLYAYMAQQGNANQIFTGLAQSADAVLTADNAILAKYNLTAPTSTGPGMYSDPKLQNLYIYLTGQSGGTTPDQLSTAAMSEEIHISDLTAALGHTDNADLRYIYNQELALSRNNLRTIIPQFTAYGQTYVPQYLSQDAFNQIISSPVETVPVSS